MQEDSPAVARTGRYVLKDAPEILRDTVTLALALLSIWIISKLLLKYLLGSDATFFDWIPIRYAFDAAHLAMLVTFFTRLFRRNKQ